MHLISVFDFRLLEGNPEPEITWSHQFRDSTYAVGPVQKLEKYVNKTTITIVRVNAYHAGEYKCSALNAVGPAERIINLIIERKALLSLKYFNNKLLMKCFELVKSTRQDKYNELRHDIVIIFRCKVVMATFRLHHQNRSMV